MTFRFRILDLIVITALVALLVGSYREDLIFFRQLCCLELAALFSAIGVFLFSKFNKRTWLIAAAAGFLSGLVYLVTTFIFVGQFFGVWEYEPRLFGSFQFVRDSIFGIWLDESLLVLLASTTFGSAIGPMLALRIRGIQLPAEFAKSFRISVGILSVILFIGILRMFDRLVNFGAVRDLTPLIVLGFIAFIIFTNKWLFRYYRYQDEASGQISDPTASTTAN